MSLFYILMLVAPSLLIALATYLHIFYGYWLDYERDRQYINQRLIPHSIAFSGNALSPA